MYHGQIFHDYRCKVKPTWIWYIIIISFYSPKYCYCNDYLKTLPDTATIHHNNYMYFEVYLSLTITRNATLVIKYNETVLRIYTSMFRPKIEHFRHGISSSVISSSALGQYLIRTKLKLGLTFQLMINI